MRILETPLRSPQGEDSQGLFATLIFDLMQSEPIPKRPALRQRSGRHIFKSYQQFSQPKTELASRIDHLTFRGRVE